MSDVTRIGERGDQARGVRVFVCYSRVQFYCAEDLACALYEHGVDAWFDVHRLRPGDDWDCAITAAVRGADVVVLVASRDALSSPHARAELDLGRELGKPVVVALAERVALPGVLAAAPSVDLRARFAKSVRLLAAALRDNELDRLATAAQLPRTRRAGVVWMVSVTLLATALLSAVLSGVMLADVGVAADAVVLLALIGALFGWLAWAFSHRVPGSTAILALAYVNSIPMGVIFGVVSALLLALTALSEERLSPGEWLYLASILCVTAAWLVAGAWSLRSASFYRWLPTGDAPRWMRRRMLARRRQRPGGDPSSGTGPVTYDIWSHEQDARVAKAIDSALSVRGHSRADGASADRQILVLSNLTPRAGLAERLAPLGRGGIVVIGAAVSLPAVEHPERFQWVDYRRRDRAALDRLAASLSGDSAAARGEFVPESIGRSVMPFGVLALGAACILLATCNLAMGIAGIAGGDIAVISGASPSRLRALCALLLGGFGLWLAMAIMARRIALRLFIVAVPSVCVGTLATPTGAQGYAVLGELFPLPYWDRVPSALLCLLVFALSLRALAGWLPPRVVRAKREALAAPPPAWWRSPAVRGVGLYAAAVTLLMMSAVLGR